MESKKAIILGDFYYDHCVGYQLCEKDDYKNTIVPNQELLQEIIDTQEKLYKLERELISQAEGIQRVKADLVYLNQAGRNGKTHMLKNKGWKQEDVSYFSKDGKAFNMHEAVEILKRELEEKLVDNI